MRRAFAVLFCWLAASGGWAEQTHFASRQVGSDWAYGYGWIDAEGQPQQMAFTLNGGDITQATEEFSDFNNDDAKEMAVRAMKQRAATMSAMGREVRVKPTATGLEISTLGLTDRENKAAEEELQLVQHQAMDAYITRQFYSKIDGVHIMPDHVRIAARYAPAMVPVARAVAKNVDTRDVRATMNYMLGFLQSIPYDKLDDRTTSNGAGFETPYALLAANKGDCDSKSVALAATLRALYPTLQIVIVYTPEHAFVGVEMVQGKHDYALRLGGAVFVLADPVGPRLEELGEIDTALAAEMSGGAFSYKAVP